MSRDKRGNTSLILSHLLSSFLILFLVACSPQRQPFQGVAREETIAIQPDALLASDGTQLPLKSWLPAGKPRAVIIALHGFNDYNNAFASPGRYFSEQGIAVYAYDQRGFGRSPLTGIWAGEDNLIDDLKQSVRQVHYRYPHTPIYILGESMGGAVAIVAVTEPGFPPVDGVILSAPAVWGAEAMSPVYRGTLWLAAHTLPEYTLTGRDLKILASNNIPMLNRMAQDPLIIKHTRIDSIYGLVELMGMAFDRIPELTMPVLLLYGGEDQVIPDRAIQAALSRFPKTPASVFYPDGYHMLLRDLQGERVQRDIVSWIKHPGRPFPSGFGPVHKD
jgi:alpha-beta hydrolase superfamily lysophospholipase